MVDDVLVWGYCCVRFVKTTRRRRGDNVYEYLSLVESVRDGSKVGHRTLPRLGEVTALRDSGQLERIVAALEARPRRERVDVGAVAAEGAPAVGAVAAVATVWGRLGLDGWFAQLGSRRISRDRRGRLGGSRRGRSGTRGTTAGLRPDPVRGEATAAAKRSLRVLAGRWRALSAEISELDAEIARLCAQAAPALLAAPGVGPEVCACGRLLRASCGPADRCASRGATGVGAGRPESVR